MMYGKRKEAKSLGSVQGTWCRRESRYHSWQAAPRGADRYTLCPVLMYGRVYQTATTTFHGLDWGRMGFAIFAICQDATWTSRTDMGSIIFVVQIMRPTEKTTETKGCWQAYPPLTLRYSCPLSRPTNSH